MPQVAWAQAPRSLLRHSGDPGTSPGLLSLQDPDEAPVSGLAQSLADQLGSLASLGLSFPTRVVRAAQLRVTLLPFLKTLGWTCFLSLAFSGKRNFSKQAISPPMLSFETPQS